MTSPVRPQNFDQTLKLVTVLGALVSFCWGVFVWSENQKAQAENQRRESDRQAATRRIEATKPFLKLQLELYKEAVLLASTISNSEPSPERARNVENLMRLYWGKLAMVENREVETAMVALRRAIIANEPNEELQRKSLNLARACRRSLDQSWGINAWTTPNDASS